MKKLRQFNKFDCEEFFKDKDVRVMAQEQWSRYEDGSIVEQLGTKYKCVIATDNTEYTGEKVEPDLNAGEQLVIKVPNQPKNFKKFSRITMVNPKGSVYGTFMSELSVTADDVEFHNPK